MTRPEHSPQPLPDDLAALLRHMAVSAVHKASIGKRSPLLWSKSFPLPGMGNDVSIELLPSLVLRVRDRVTGEVFMQTEPVQFGPLALPSKTIAEKFEAWCLSRSAAQEAAPAEPADQKPSAEGSEA